MKFEKGNPGKPKGSTSHVNRQTKELISTLLQNEFEHIEEYKSKITPAEWLNILVRLVPYVVPKQTQVEATVTEYKQPDWDKLFK